MGKSEMSFTKILDEVWWGYSLPLGPLGGGGGIPLFPSFRAM